MTRYLCDSNVWLALALSKHVHHARAAAWFDGLAPESAAFCRATQTTFLRLMTSAAVLGAYGNEPLTNREAWRAYEELLDDERVAFVDREPPGVEGVWKDFASRGAASPKLWMDAYLAAFAATGERTLATTDRAFRQFRGLDVALLA